MQSKEMFAGLRVLELASVLAGPSVGQFFAELGAEVIKIENLQTGGDVTRSWRSADEPTDDRSAYFCCCNWGKQSVALDLRQPAARERLKALVIDADVVIASYKPGDAEKLGVSYEQLKTINQQLIYGQITGYGSDDERVGYDAVIQAESGFMELNGEKEGPPVKMPVALIDVLASHQLKEALLMALLHRERTGEGGFVEVSLIQTALSSLANQATNWLVGKKIPQRQGSAHPNIAPYGDWFETHDGKKILLAVGSDRQFEDLMEVVGLIHWDLGTFATNQQRVKNRAQLNQLLSDKIREMNSHDLMVALLAKKIPGGLIQNVQEALAMPVAKEIMLEHEEFKGVRNFVGKMSFAQVKVKLDGPPRLERPTRE
jgi:crotonobetainyl-CoA:carnitine CoA-transferase CaiB-like acyl-CoA transferase